MAAFPVTAGALAVAAAGWLVALRRAGEVGARDERGATIAVVAVAVLARLLLLAPAVPFSDDLYRYLWDGRVANAGVNPFLHAPDAPELVDLRDDSVWPEVNHPDIPTIYPPVAQLVFALLDRVAPTPLGARAAAALFDLAGFAALALLLRRRGRPAPVALAHGWCPLAIVESAGGGHVDAAGVALLVAAFLAMEAGKARRDVLGGVLAGLSALVKPMVVFAAPAVLRAGAAPRGAAILGGAALSLVLVVPYAAAGERLFAGFLAYAEHWRFNDLFYSGLVGAGLTPREARIVLGAALVLVSLAVAVRRTDPPVATGIVFGAFLLVSPTVHPWYALWLVPFLPFLPAPLRPGGLALVALLPASYAAAWASGGGADWVEPAWSRWLVWLPVVALLTVGGVRSILRGESRGAPPGRSSRGS